MRIIPCGRSCAERCLNMPPKSAKSGGGKSADDGASEREHEALLQLANKEYVKPELSLPEWPDPHTSLDGELVERGKKVFERFDTASTGSIASTELGPCLRALGFHPAIVSKSAKEINTTTLCSIFRISC